MRIALVVPRSLDDDAVRDASIETYRDLVAEGHDVDCFVVADPSAVDELAAVDRTRLCVVDHGYRAERWSARPPIAARLAQQASTRVAAVRLRTLVARAHRMAPYDAFVQPRWAH